MGVNGLEELALDGGGCFKLDLIPVMFWNMISCTKK
jgi:hypothetical protein